MHDFILGKSFQVDQSQDKQSNQLSINHIIQSDHFFELNTEDPIPLNETDLTQNNQQEEYERTQSPKNDQSNPQAFQEFNISDLFELNADYIDSDNDWNFNLVISQEDFNFIQSQRTNKTNTNQTPIPIQSKKSVNRKSEIEKIRENPSYEKPIEGTYLYRRLKNKTRDNVRLLGKWYNRDHKKKIDTKIKDFPKFKKVDGRKKNIEFWFFQNLIDNPRTRNIILPWINEKINKINSQ